VCGDGCRLHTSRETAWMQQQPPAGQRAAADAGSTEAAEATDTDASGWTLLPSTPARYMDGGYAAHHYVAASPDAHALCVELRPPPGGGEALEPVGYLACGVMGWGDPSHAPLPRLPSARAQATVMSVYRLVVRRSPSSTV
jgi:hypothetical protein